MCFVRHCCAHPVPEFAVVIRGQVHGEFVLERLRHFDLRIGRGGEHIFRPSHLLVTHRRLRGRSFQRDGVWFGVA